MKKLIRYNRFNELEAWIQDCREESEDGDEPICMALEGQTGAGKSTLVKTYAKAYPRRLVGTQTEVPVFYVETSSPATIKALASDMLTGLGDPGANKGTLWELNTRLVRYLSDCKVQLVILDDFHHLVDLNRNKILHQTADWLKVLIKRSDVPFLITGIDGQVKRILKANSQLSRLFVSEELKPFEWDMKRPKTIENFAAFITFVAGTFEVTLPRDIGDVELLYRIHYATGGVMGYMMYLFRKASRLSRQMDMNGELTLDILKIAFEKRLRRHVSRQNPFETAADKAFVPSNVGVTLDDPAGTTNRGKKRISKPPTTSTVLTTK